MMCFTLELSLGSAMQEVAIMFQKQGNTLQSDMENKHIKMLGQSFPVMD